MQHDDLSFEDALDRIIAYLGAEEDDYDASSRNQRKTHIWTAVRVLMRHRAEIAGQAPSVAMKA